MNPRRPQQSLHGLNGLPCSLYTKGLKIPARQSISSGLPAPQNVAKSSIALDGLPQRLPLPMATGFVLLIHTFYIIPQVETLKFYLLEEQFFLSGSHERTTKSLKRGILEECLVSF